MPLVQGPFLKSEPDADQNWLHFSLSMGQLMEEDTMFGFIFGAAVGVASYWAYQRYVVGSDDDAFADFDTGTIDRPTASEVHGRPSESVPGYSEPKAGTNPSA